MTHSPGPWKYVPGLPTRFPCVLIADNEELIMNKAANREGGPNNEFDGNGMLIAAAPELATLAGRIATATDADWARPSFVQAVRMAGQALHAKVEGRA